jgi:hypothetical protein
MRSSNFMSIRHGFIAIAGFVTLSLVSLVHAQTPPPTSTATDTVENTGALGRQNQKIEHIRIEDKGATVDEMRYGGQTQSITVKPKSDMPSYEVRPNDGSRTAPPGQAETGANGNGPRVWNVLKF